MIARKICSTIERNLKIHYTTGHFIPKKYLNLVFYYNRNLKISKSKKSDRYFRDKIEIFIRLFDAIFKVTDARRDVILAGGLYHRFPWRHLSPLYGTKMRLHSAFEQQKGSGLVFFRFWSHSRLWPQKQKKSESGSIS